MAAQLLLLARHFSPPVAADRELLDRFTSTRDNEAFSELVRRHGPIVYRICRRLVGTAAADDAFQATFLLLATRATAAKAANSVGGWLVGVAGRVARQIRRASQRRQQHESMAACQTRVESTDSTPDLLDQFRILDEELACLPDRLRDPLVSCLLQGRTQEETAAESGHTTRTVRRRLEEAKRLLRDRLLRRGVTPVVATGLVTGLASVSVAIPVGLGMRTVAVVFDFLTGGVAIASPPVVLAKGVATTMLARKVMTLMAVVAVGLTSLGIVLAEDPKPNQPPTTAKMEPPQPLPGQPTPQPSSSAPIQPPLAPAANEAANKPSEEMQQRLQQLAKTLKPGETKVVITGLCMGVTGGFCEESGFTPDNTKTGEKAPWVLTTLNPREAKMFRLMLIGLKAQNRLDILSRPQLTVLENQTGYFQAGQTIEVSTPTWATDDNGKTVSTPKTKMAFSSLVPSVSLRVTPRIDKDSGNILLRVYSQTTSIAPPVTDGQNAQTTQVGPTFNTETVETTLMLPDGGTAIVGNAIGSTQDEAKKTEMLWVLTAHVVRGKP